MRLLAFPALLLNACVLAQQFAGETIKNSLPASSGAQVAFFNIRDANGKNTTLINYYSFPGGKNLDQSKVQRAIVVIHGALRNAGDYFTNVHGRVAAANAINSEVSDQTVAIFAPLFANDQDKTTAYPFTGGKSTTSALVWPDYFWFQGINNIYPAGQATVSSFDVIDQVFQWFADKNNFPNLKEIVFAGHSMGAQMVQRYAVVSKDLALPVPISFWMGNPSAFAWLNSSRPVSPGTCKIYDQWSSGLQGYGVGNYTYNAGTSATSTIQAMRANYATHRMAYARALKDFGDASNDCSPFSQGANRGERFFSFMTYFPPNQLATIDYVANSTHDAVKMMSDISGLTRLFLDNWSGDGNRAPDFGARQIDGDDPHPVASGTWQL